MATKRPASNGVNALNVVLYDENMEFYVKVVKPFLLKHKEQSGSFPNWEILQEEFKGKIKDFRAWFYRLYRRYYAEFNDAMQTKKNNNYLPKWGIPLKDRFDEIDQLTPKKGRSKTYTTEQVDAVADML